MENGQLPVDFRFGKRCISFNEDQVVLGLVQLLGPHQELLVELLAGAEAGFNDFNALYAGETDHVLCEVIDLYGLAHIEDEELAILRHGTALEHELGSLRNGHEVADDPLVGDGDGTAVCDLALEERNHGTGRAQDIAEAGGAVLHAAAAAGGLDDHLAHPLGGAHDIGGIHRLVGGHHHEALGLIDLTELHQIFRAEDIVINGLHAVMLHEGHMLMGCRVDDDLGAILIEYPLQRLFMGDGADFNLQIQCIAVGNLQLLLHIVGTVLVDVQDDDLLRAHLRKLPAELRADGATAAGDEDHLALVIGIGPLIGHHQGLPEEELLGIEFTEVTLRTCRIDSGEVIDLQLVAGFLVIVIQLLLPIHVNGVDGEDDFLYAVLVQLLHGSLALRIHGETANLTTDLLLVYINKALRHVGGLTVVQELVREGHTHAAGADNCHFNFLDLLLILRLYPRKEMQNPCEESALQGFLIAALIGVAVKHTNHQRPQQIQAAETKHPCKGNFLRQKHQLRQAVHPEADGVCTHQTNVALNAAVSPDLSVDISQKSYQKDTDKGQNRLIHHTSGRQAFISPIQHQHQEYGYPQNRCIIENQCPADTSLSFPAMCQKTHNTLFPSNSYLLQRLPFSRTNTVRGG